MSAKCMAISGNGVFLQVFNDISTYVYVFTEYFLHPFSNLSFEFLVVL